VKKKSKPQVMLSKEEAQTIILESLNQFIVKQELETKLTPDHAADRSFEIVNDTTLDSSKLQSNSKLK
jgi:hypothetical protein